MSDAGPISLGDLARVKKTLRPADALTWNRILELLGLPLEMRAASTAGSAKPEGFGDPELFGGPGDGEEEKPETTTPAPSAKAVFAPGDNLRVEPAGSAYSSPAWSDSTNVFASGGHGGELDPPPALFAPGHSRALLTAVAISVMKSGELDEERAIEEVARGELLHEIPLRLRPTSRFGVQLLVDRGPRLQPFREDQQHLTANLFETVGVHRIEVLRFSGFPDRVGPGTPRTWAPYLPPAAGTVVLVVSDLGLGRLGTLEPRYDLGDWIAWGRRVRSSGAHPVALVAHGRDHWPEPLRQVISLVHWDRSTTVGEVRIATKR